MKAAHLKAEKPNKLRLNKTTIAKLSERTLRQVYGGNKWPLPDTWDNVNTCTGQNTNDTK